MSRASRRRLRVHTCRAKPNERAHSRSSNASRGSGLSSTRRASAVCCFVCALRPCVCTDLCASVRVCVVRMIHCTRASLIRAALLSKTQNGVCVFVCKRLAPSYAYCQRYAMCEWCVPHVQCKAQNARRQVRRLASSFDELRTKQSRYVSHYAAAACVFLFSVFPVSVRAHTIT